MVGIEGGVRFARAIEQGFGGPFVRVGVAMDAKIFLARHFGPATVRAREPARLPIIDLLDAEFFA